MNVLPLTTDSPVMPSIQSSSGHHTSWSLPPLLSGAVFSNSMLQYGKQYFSMSKVTWNCMYRKSCITSRTPN